jgi:hypothetical protein
MNRNATSYQWEIVGFGNPIYKTTPTMTHLYPYSSAYEKTNAWLVVLRTNDIPNNCGDTVTQSIVIKNRNYSIYAGIKEESNTSVFSLFLSLFKHFGRQCFKSAQGKARKRYN